MEERNEISVELSALSELVSGIGRETPYGVPTGYFDQFPVLMMVRIGASHSAFPPSTFQVPDGYFDGFASSVLARIKAGRAGDEELPPIFGKISRVTPFSVPENYFEELSPVLSILHDKPAYEVPQGYFDELCPVLTVAHDRSTYQVPAGYFAGLPERILEKVVATEKVSAKVIGMDGRDTESSVTARPGAGKVLKGNWWKYSSVASIAACLLLIFSWPQVDTKVYESSMAIETRRGLEKLSDQEIQAYLDDQHAILTESALNSTAALDNTSASLEMNEGDVKSLLGQISDNDLQQYIEEHGKAEDLATN